ncbi:m7GpppN-mRNA hydrolase [Porphyridium purpureum]|uniref:M7GpppN-mRNA hydrolase n=1 Tax=Porphyridium purpureum TaxID=35688 RepID=A0A5J4Z7D0_PORPP|nr:m7GpppN-mRNA hydrolase [Porphyridium purpureum]|eukprot:POR2237..scf295_1
MASVGSGPGAGANGAGSSMSGYTGVQNLWSGFGYAADSERDSGAVGGGHVSVHDQAQAHVQSAAVQQSTTGNPYGYVPVHHGAANSMRADLEYPFGVQSAHWSPGPAGPTTVRYMHDESEGSLPHSYGLPHPVPSMSPALLPQPYPPSWSSAFALGAPAQVSSTSEFLHSVPAQQAAVYSNVQDSDAVSAFSMHQMSSTLPASVGFAQVHRSQSDYAGNSMSFSTSTSEFTHRAGAVNLPQSSISVTSGRKQFVLEDVLDDLCSRFLLSLPDSEFEDSARIFFAIEAAYWFYDDFYCDKDDKLPRKNEKEFARMLFRHSELLRPRYDEFEALFAEFQSYKREVPSCGIALCNQAFTKVILVKAWNVKGKWGLPKGKLAKDEHEMTCARREVFEETGFDAGNLLREDDYLDAHVSGRHVRIYVVQGVPEEYPFEPRTRKEISEIKWHSIQSLPDDHSAQNARKMWGVVPFSKGLKNMSKKGKRERKDVTASSPAPSKDAASTVSSTNSRRAKLGKGGNGEAQPPARGSAWTADSSDTASQEPGTEFVRLVHRGKRVDDSVTFGIQGQGAAHGLTAAEKKELYDNYLREVEERAEKAAEKERIAKASEELIINARNSKTFFTPSRKDERHDSAEGDFVSGMYVEPKDKKGMSSAGAPGTMRRTASLQIQASEIDPLLTFEFDRAKIMACFV